MSQENVDAMQAAVDAFNQRDGNAFGALLAEDAEIVPVRAALEGTVYRGRNAGTDYCAAVEASWENLAWEVEEIRDGENWVLALGRIRGAGRDSGAGIDARGAWLARFREGKMTHFRTYPDRSDALKAVGLEEEAMSQENVAVVRRAIEAFNRREIDAAVRCAHPDVEVDWSRSRGVEAGIYRGREGTARFWGTFYESFDRIEAVPEEFIEHGDYVIVRDRTLMWGRDGIEVAARNVGLVTFRDGLILRWQLCRDVAEALKAVGLEE